MLINGARRAVMHHAWAWHLVMRSQRLLLGLLSALVLVRPLSGLCAEPPQPLPAPTPPLPAPLAVPASPPLPRQLNDDRWGELIRPVETLASRWDFVNALQTLERLPLNDAADKARAAERRDDLEHAKTLKDRLIAAVSKAALAGELRKSDLQMRGISGVVVKADEQGITAQLVTGKNELQAWETLGEKALQKVFLLAVDRSKANDWMAAGLLALASREGKIAEKCFDQARSLGASIDRYRALVGEESLAEVGRLIGKKDLAGARAALTSLGDRFGRTEWYAAREPAITALRTQVNDPAGRPKSDTPIAKAAGKIPAFDAVGLELRQTFTAHGNINGLAFSPHNPTTLTTVAHDHIFKYWDATTGRLLGKTEGDSGAKFGVSFHPKQNVLVVADEGQTATIWNPLGNQVAKFKGHTAAVTAVAFSPNGLLLASASYDFTVRLWDAQGRVRSVLQDHTDRALCVAFSPDSAILASGSSDRSIKLWDCAKGQLLKTLSGHEREVTGLTFALDGKTLISGSGDGTVRSWEVATGQPRGTWREHTAAVFAIALSPDGKLIASGSEDRSVAFLDLATGKLVRRLQDHKEMVRAVAFSPNGYLFASGSNDGIVCIWDWKK